LKTLTIFRAIAPLLALAGAGWVALQVSRSAPRAERRPVEASAPVVELRRLAPVAANSVVRATGIVTPAEEMVVTPQVSGEVVYVSKALVPGGTVRAGQVLARIDPRDYELAVEQQRGAVRGAALDVEREEAQQDLARHEWDVLGESGSATSLFSRESQRAAAEASLSSGKSTLQRAKLNLDRTVLRAPFDATVITESASIGQVVGPQTALAQLIGTGDMWVMVSVQLDELSLIDIPGIKSAKGASKAATGSVATVTQRLARSDSIVRQGRVTRLVGRLDERTRRAQLVVSIPDALSTEAGLPMLPGAHVQVEIVGRQFDAVFPIPRVALYEGDVVWVANQGLLERRAPDIIWGDRDTVYAASGLEPGEQLLVTRLSSPMVGMAVKALEPAEGRERSDGGDRAAAPATVPAGAAAAGAESH
jgi:RND family efflux transporter MFP subunit